MVHKCLAKKVEERFASVSEMARALAPFTSDPSIVERIERVAAAVPLPSAPRVSRASLATFTPVPSTAATGVSWSGAVDGAERSFQELETSAPAAPPARARLFPVVAAVGAVVVAIGAAAITVSLTSRGASGSTASGRSSAPLGVASTALEANTPDSGALALAVGPPLDTAAPPPAPADAPSAAPAASSASPASSVAQRPSAASRPTRPTRRSSRGAAPPGRHVG